MPNLQSERRLHPISFLFQLAAQSRQVLLPGVFVLIAGARGGGDAWQVWAMLFFVPMALLSIARTLVFRYRMDPEELVIQSGLIFRQQRHVPYERIQNIDAIQNVVHRLFGVVEVRLETAGGTEPEAQMSVVSVAAFEELRAGVHAIRGQAADAAAPVDREPASTLLQLPARELVIAGLIQGRGLIVIGALFGLLWEAGLLDRMTGSLFGGSVAGRGLLRQILRAGFGGGGTPWQTIGLTLVAFGMLLVVTRAFSVGWSLVRLHAFTLRKAGEDLRADFGLLTRVTATIPVRRIQSVTLHEGPLHRMFGRASVRVETAGGESDESVQLQRQWLAPVIRPADIPALLAVVLPAAQVDGVDWQPVDPRGVRRARLRGLTRAAILSLALVAFLDWWTLALFAALAAIGEVHARRSVRALGWAATGTGVHFRSGWLWRRLTFAPFAKVQVVGIQQTPFDRRLGMASVEVDMAGTTANGHRIDIPYLSAPVARSLAARLAHQAARTAFRW